MTGNVPHGVAIVLALTPEQRADWIASCEEMLADYDQDTLATLATLADFGVDVDDVVAYNRAVLDGVRAQLAKG